MRKESLNAEKVFEVLLSNSEVGALIELKKEFKNRELTIEEVEEFVKEVHRNSLILFNVINGD